MNLKERFDDMDPKTKKIVLGFLGTLAVLMLVVFFKGSKPHDDAVSNNPAPTDQVTAAPGQSQPSSTPIDTDALDSVASQSSESYATELPDNLDSFNTEIPSSKKGTDKSNVPVYTADNATEFKVVKSKKYQGDESAPILTDKNMVKGWVPVLTGFANVYGKTFTDAEQVVWRGNLSQFLSPNILDMMPNDASRVSPAMPDSIEIIKAGNNFVTAKINMNNNRPVIAAVVKNGNDWIINYLG